MMKKCSFLFALFAFLLLMLLWLTKWRGMMGMTGMTGVWLGVKEDGNDQTGHWRFQPFPFTITPKNPCPQEIKTLFVIHSSIRNHERRAIIRETYLAKEWLKRYNFRSIFVVAQSEKANEEVKIREEVALHDDILQIGYIDAYRNLTMKFVNWMRYVRDECPEVTRIVKLDDDTLPNIFWLFNDLNAGKIPKEKTFTCKRWESTAVREITNQWYVSPEAQPRDHWETFCQSSAMIISSDLLPALIQQIERKKLYIAVDDAFITGQIAKEIGAKHNFKLYEKNCFFAGSPLYDGKIDLPMIMGKIIFGEYQTSAQMKRIFHQLSILNNFVTDPPDNFPKSIKEGPKNEE